MEDAVMSSVSQWGPFGILIVFAIYIIYNHIKGMIESKNNDNKEYKNISHDTDIIITQINALKTEYSLKTELVNNRIDSLKETFNHKHEILNKRLVNLEDRVAHQPTQLISSLEDYTNRSKDEHNRRLLEQVEMGPKIHRVLSRYIDIIDCDHILLGAFHNGTVSLNGIPYCRFDIISEKFNSNEHTFEVEFAPMYKNVDITLHNKLPMLLFQNGKVYYKMSSSDCDLKEIDEILYRRLLGRGIEQLAMHILRDSNDIPIGFVVCIRYDNREMVHREISQCAKELEDIYNEHANKI